MEPDDTNNKNMNTATLRSGWNVGVATLIMGIVFRITGWELNPEYLALFAPAVGIVAAAFYRISRVLAEEFPKVGYVLFGTKKAPVAFAPPAPPAAPNGE